LRIQRILNTTSIPAGLTSLSATPVNNVCDFPPAVNAANAFQTVTNSENGELFISSRGILTFFAQQYWANNTRSNTSQATFTDSGTGVGYDGSGVTYKVDADNIRNYVTVGFSGGGEVFASDASSISTNGAASESVSTVLETADSAQTLANYVVTIYKNPKLQIEPFMSKGQANPSYNWPRLLALELLDRITFVRTPSVGSAVTKDLLVQSIEHRITPGEWQTVVNGSARYTNWFIIGSSLIGGADLLLN